MYCPKCNRFTLQIEHIGPKAKVNKLCNRCLQNEIVANFQYLDDIESLTHAELFPQSYFLLSKSGLMDLNIEDFAQEFSNLIWDKYGYRFL